MKRIAIALLSLVLFVSAPLMASNWNPIAIQVQKSISFLENSEGSCTAFSIDSKRDYVLTAAHCLGSDPEGKDILVDQSPVKVISKDSKHDLLVLEVKGIDKPSLRLAKENPKIGDEVASYGYGLGLERPLFRVSHVSDDKTTIDGSGLPTNLIAVDTQFVPGQSGGPVVDVNGDLVMIVEAGGQGVGLGPGAEVIKSKVGKYFEQR